MLLLSYIRVGIDKKRGDPHSMFGACFFSSFFPRRFCYFDQWHEWNAKQNESKQNYPTMCPAGLEKKGVLQE